MILNKEEIKSLIPHREPFLFLDRCDIIKIGFEGIGYRKFLNSEFFFKGHFPLMPIVPGVVIIEALAQTAGVVVSKQYSNPKNKSVLFMSISRAKFRKPVFPNEEISLKVNYVNKVKSVYKFLGIASNENAQKVCEVEFSAMITNKSDKEIF